MPPKRACRLALLAAAAAYLLFLLLFELPSFAFTTAAPGNAAAAAMHRARRRELEAAAASAPRSSSPARPLKPAFPLPVSSVRFHRRPNSSFDASASAAFAAARPHLARLLLSQAASASPSSSPSPSPSAASSCPATVSALGDRLATTAGVAAVELPCGMAVGSRVTVVARPRAARAQGEPRIAARRVGGAPVMVSQFMVELLGTKAVEGEEPPRVLHFNPRIRRDFSGRPVIELNTCYRMQWAQPQRCEGFASRPDEDTAGLEGYHVSVDGRHVTSFPYRTGYNLEDAMELSLKGDLDVESVVASYLPSSPPSFASQSYLEMSEQWKASPLPTEPVELFVGILSAASHFAERMAVRKSWMISTKKTPNVVARFFVALSGKNEINEELKKEAKYFGDIVIVPFMDNYDLVVLKTIAIVEYGVKVVPAKHIMKCDDDTFVRIESVLDQIKKVQSGKSMYVGNINYYHRPLRSGKWSVTYEVIYNT
nr:unnamed protein product [Digitaria exilis]